MQKIARICVILSPMRNLIAFIPHLLTLGNLLCGCLALLFIFEWKLSTAALLVGLAALLDFFDGFVARLLGVSGELGKQLDSLADAVTFGVVPGMLMYQWLIFSTQSANDSFSAALPYVALLIPLFAVFRLAKFNIDSRQSDSFIGLPTPANGIFFCSFPLIVSASFAPGTAVNMTGLPEKLLFNPVAVAVMIVLMCIAMVAELPLFALKFKRFGWKGNEIRYLFLGLSLVFLIVLQYAAIPFIILLYLVLSVLNLFISRT